MPPRKIIVEMAGLYKNEKGREAHELEKFRPGAEVRRASVLAMDSERCNKYL